jgi:hypothetical protein
LVNSLARLTKRRKEKTQLNKIRDEKEDSTTATNKIQKSLREYFKSLYSKLGARGSYL